jgi:hypothetical protein
MAIANTQKNPSSTAKTTETMLEMVTNWPVVAIATGLEEPKNVVTTSIKNTPVRDSLSPSRKMQGSVTEQKVSLQKSYSLNSTPIYHPCRVSSHTQEFIRSPILRRFINNL